MTKTVPAPRPSRRARPSSAVVVKPASTRLSAARPVTLVEQIVDSIVQGAAEGRFLPGDRLNEGEIAQELDVSRVPVREALRLLESQGIAVKPAPGRGLVLMPVTAKRIHEILVVRATLEQLAAQEVVRDKHRVAAVLNDLKIICAEMKLAAQHSNGYQVAKLDTSFHRVLCRHSGNEVLLQIWETLARKLTIIFGLSALQKNLNAIHREHMDLMKALETRQGKRVAAAIEDHIIIQTERIDYEAIVARRRAR